MTETMPPGRRWGVLGTANIAARAFLPALREAGGHAVSVGSRSPDRATEWAAANQVARTDSYVGRARRSAGGGGLYRPAQ